MYCFPFLSQPSHLPQSPSKNHLLPLRAQGDHRGPLSPFLAISCAVGQKRVDIFTHLPCVNVEQGTPVKRAIILICARLGGGGRRDGGGSSLEANKAAVIFSACVGGITVRQWELYWMFAHQDES